MRRVAQTKPLTREYRHLLGDLRRSEERIGEIERGLAELDDEKAQALEIRRKLEGIALTLRILDPEWSEPTSPLPRRRKPWGDLPSGTLLRTAFEFLGRADEPMSALELAERVMPKVVPGREFSRGELNSVATSLAMSLKERSGDLIEIVGSRPRRFKVIRP